MVFLMLGVMLVLSVAASAGVVQPVVSAFGRFMLLYGLYIAGCMVLGYMLVRKLSEMSTGRPRVLASPPGSSKSAGLPTIP
jgi:hypothetical protein